MNMTAEDKELVRPAIEKAGECGVEFLKGATADELMAKFNRRA